MSEDALQMTNIIYQVCDYKRKSSHVLSKIHIKKENKTGRKGKFGVWAKACLDSKKQEITCRLPWQCGDLRVGGMRHGGDRTPGGKLLRPLKARLQSLDRCSFPQQGPLQKAPRGSTVWEIKLGFGSRRPGPRLLPAKGGGGVRVKRASFPSARGFSAWKMEITPPIRKGLGGLCVP